MKNKCKNMTKMLIFTDQVLKNFETDSCFQLVRYPNITLVEYLKIQSCYSNKKKNEINNTNVVVYCFGYNDIIDDSSDGIFLIDKYEELLRGKVITYIITPPGFTVDFSEACMEQFPDDLNMIDSLLGQSKIPNNEDTFSLKIDLLEISCLYESKKYGERK